MSSMILNKLNIKIFDNSIRKFYSQDFFFQEPMS